ncbi:MAG: hypothetical protein AAF488_04000 [Planctomycetota bacterium]
MKTHSIVLTFTVLIVVTWVWLGDRRSDAAESSPAPASRQSDAPNVADIQAEVEKKLDYRLQRIEEAIALEPASGADEELSRLHRMGRALYSSLGSKRLVSFLNSYPDHDSRAWVFKKAIGSFNHLGRAEEAMDLVAAEEKRVGPSFDLTMHRAVIQLCAGEYDKAKAIFESLAFQKDEPLERQLRAHLYVAYTDLQAGHFGAAVRHCDQVIRRGKNVDSVHVATHVSGARIMKKKAREWLRTTAE